MPKLEWNTSTQTLGVDSGRAAKANVYPDALCRAIRLGVEDQIKADSAGQFLLMNVNYEGDTTTQDLKREGIQIRKQYKIVEE